MKTKKSGVILAILAIVATCLLAACGKSERASSDAAAGADQAQVVASSTSGPKPGVPFTNSLGMRFVAIPGADVHFSVWETRVRDYEAFVAATKWSWTQPGFPQGGDHPVVRVSWDDAEAFCAWLTQAEQAAGRLGTDQVYRLPTDWEWSLAVGLSESREGAPSQKHGKIADRFPWGSDWPPPRGAGNYSSNLSIDTFGMTAPVGSFVANSLGLHDLGGNVWEWVDDYYDGKGGNRTLRGASFNSGDRGFLLASNRHHEPPGTTKDFIGFRVVLEAGPAR